MYKFRVYFIYITGIQDFFIPTDISQLNFAYVQISIAVIKKFSSISVFFMLAELQVKNMEIKISYVSFLFTIIQLGIEIVIKALNITWAIFLADYWRREVSGFCHSELVQVHDSIFYNSNINARFSLLMRTNDIILGFQNMLYKYDLLIKLRIYQLFKRSFYKKIY